MSPIPPTTAGRHRWPRRRAAKSSSGREPFPSGKEVIPSGDEGSLANHAGGDYNSQSEKVIGISKVSTNFAVMSAWYTGSQPAEVTGTFDDGTIVGPVGPGGSASLDGPTRAGRTHGVGVSAWGFGKIDVYETVRGVAEIFSDGFESGDTSVW